MRNLIFGLVAGLIAWWLWRKLAPPCHCDEVPAPAPTIPVLTPPPPPAPVVYVAPPAPAYVAPPPPVPTYVPPLYTPPPPAPAALTPAQACVLDGGAWGWDPNTGPKCYDITPIPIPSPPPAWTPPAPPQTCEQLGGTTLNDGSCCRPDLGCDPGPPGCATDEIQTIDAFGRVHCKANPALLPDLCRNWLGGTWMEEEQVCYQ